MALTKEWRRVKGEWGFKYEVSNYGEVRNINTGRVMKGYVYRGYKTVYFNAPGNILAWPKVHTLVLEAFHKKRPKGKECNHRDGNTQNNRITNLEWVTHKYNMYHSFNIIKNRAVGENSVHAKYSDKLIAKARALRYTKTMREISEITGIAKNYLPSLFANTVRKGV